MSTPGEPEGSKRSGPGTTERPEHGDTNGAGSGASDRGVQDSRPAATDGSNGSNGSNGHGPGSDEVARPAGGTGPGGRPPWQRVGSTRPNPGGPVQPNQAVPPTPQGPPAAPARPNPQGSNLDRSPNPQGSQAPQAAPAQQVPPINGAPSRPLVTGSAVKPTPAESSDAATTRAPISKLDADGKVGGGPAADPAKGRNSVTGKVIDGPTRNIDRNNLPEDLPDLDAIHHPTGMVPPVDPGVGAARPVETFAAGPRGPLRASVQLRRIDPWSTFKISSVLAIALFLIWMIAIGVLYVILDGMGVWDQLNGSFGDLVSSDSSTDTSFQITAGGVFGIAALIGAVYVIVFTALTTVGAFIYNMSADLVGGVEVTLADRD